MRDHTDHASPTAIPARVRDALAREDAAPMTPLEAVKATRAALGLLVQALDIEAEATTLTFTVVSPTERREVAKVSIATLLRRADAAIAAADGARPDPITREEVVQIGHLISRLCERACADGGPLEDRGDAVGDLNDEIIAALKHRFRDRLAAEPGSRPDAPPSPHAVPPRDHA